MATDKGLEEIPESMLTLRLSFGTQHREDQLPGCFADS